MINYSQFNATDDHAYNIARAIDYCKKNNIDGIKFEKGTYELSPKLAMTGTYCVSNHTLKGTANWIGDTVEELTMYPKIIFKNNEVRENRARGVLLASKGDTLIEGNLFHTPGASILFESDGEYWYESGGVGEVIIKDNIFDDCNFVNELWGPATISIKKRNASDGKNFYHKHIIITGNKFTGNKKPALSAANVGVIEFTNNITEGETIYADCGEIIEKDNQFI